MSIVDFELSDNNSFIKISGSDFDLNSLKKFYEIIKQLNHESNLKKICIIGNFNSKLLINDIFSKDNKNELDSLLLLLQSITKTIEDSNILFISNINGIAEGPALEIALSCNFIEAKVDSTFNFTNNEQVPFFGTIQRLIRILGYQKTLQLLLIEKSISYSAANTMKIINSKIDNTMNRKKPFWDQAFTNTFIFFNSKLHSTYRNRFPLYPAILSIIFESSICDYEVGLSIEKRWIKWLMLEKIKNS